MENISTFVSTGIDLKGYKHILGYWVMKGRENVGFWAEVLQSLISRGLSKVAILVTDHFSGVDNLIPKLFPLREHQFCFIHLYRKLKNKLTLKSMKEVYKILQSNRGASDIEEGRKHIYTTNVVESINAALESG